MYDNHIHRVVIENVAENAWGTKKKIGKTADSNDVISHIARRCATLLPAVQVQLCSSAQPCKRLCVMQAADGFAAVSPQFHPKHTTAAKDALLAGRDDSDLRQTASSGR
jgi:hypothetical protein